MSVKITELKPCPFCNAHLQLSENLSTRNQRTYVHEPNGCVVQSIVLCVSSRPEEVERVNAWNRRTLSAHTAEKGEAEPVAWQRRIRAGYRAHTDDPGPWEECGRLEAKDMFRREPRYEYRPLYAHPAPPSDLVAEVDRLREALRRLVATYTGMEDGDGNLCPDVEFGRAALSEGRTDA